MAAVKDGLRREVIAVYKGMTPSFSTWYMWAMLNCHTELLNLGKDYPLGYSYFRPRLHKAFSSQAGLTDEAEIRKGIDRAYFVKKGMIRFYVCFSRTRLICAAEIEALYVHTPAYTWVKKNIAKYICRYYLKKYRSLRQSYYKP